MKPLNVMVLTVLMVGGWQLVAHGMPAPPDITPSAPAGHVIYVDKGLQRVYGFDGGRLVFEAVCSTAAHHPHYAPGEDRYLTPITPVGSFHIFERTPDHYSRTYQVHMRYALFYDGGRALHATYPSEYRYLGSPASGGCVRLTLRKAISLYDWARVGDPVYVVRALPETVAEAVAAAHPRPVLVMRTHTPPVQVALRVQPESRPAAATTVAALPLAGPESIEPAAP